MRELYAATIDALRLVPNAPGLKFKVYLDNAVSGFDFSRYVVTESLGDIDWTLERSYAQLSPGDIQFKIHDIEDGFETFVVDSATPAELQIWCAPEWGGAMGMPGGWAMIFHGYIEPSGITRSSVEPGAGAEPMVPVKDVYAKSYLAARLDTVRAAPLDAWTGVRPLEEIVRMLGDGLIANAGHEAINYDIEIRQIPTAGLVLSAWLQSDQGNIHGQSWIIREDVDFWHILNWYATTQTLYQYRLDKRTYRVSETTELLHTTDNADHGRFHYVDRDYVLLTLSRHEDFTSALPPTDFAPLVLKEAVLIRRSDSHIWRWRADDHQLVVGGFKWKPTGYCAVADAPAGKHLVLWMDQFWDDVGGIPAWDDSFVMATLSMADLMADNDPGWNGGIIGIPGYICGGATCSTDNAGVVHASATLADLVNPGRKTYLVIASGNGAGFAGWHLGPGITNLGTIPLGTMMDANHEHSRTVAGNAIYEDDDAALYYYIFGNASFAMTQSPALYLQEYRHDDNDWPECIGMVDHTGHHHVVHFYTISRTGVLAEDFYAPGDTLQLANGGGYFTKLNWVPLASRGITGTTGHFWGWRSYGFAPLVLIADSFFPLFDLDNAGPAADESVRGFIGRLCEATAHMVLFPGRLSASTALVWRVRPRHTQPPEYTISERDVLADSIEIQGPRKLRVIVTTQGNTYVYPATETLALNRMSELTISNDGIPPSVADDFASWLYDLFDAQNQIMTCGLDGALWVEVGDSVEVPLGEAVYMQGVVTRQTLLDTNGKMKITVLGDVNPVNRLIPLQGVGT